MYAHPNLERCFSFLNCQVQPLKKAVPGITSPRRRALTISRQAGCGAHVIAEKLVEYLEHHGPKDGGPWAVFDHNLVEKVIEDHHLPVRLANFLREDRISELSDIIEDLCGLHPPSWLLVRKTAQTILHLAELGNVILIGRGAHVITSRLEHVVHIRLVGSFQRRVELVQQSEHMDKNAASDFVRREDNARKRYVRKFYKVDIDDPQLYHLVLNTDVVPCETAVRAIGEVVLGPTRHALLPSAAQERADLLLAPTAVTAND